MPVINKQKTTKTPNPTRNPEATKNQILDAAEAEFAVTGLGAARTEAIAAQTGVTKAIIYRQMQPSLDYWKRCCIACRKIPASAVFCL
jgi:Bacterial regulatory proteins, tetR family